MNTLFFILFTLDKLKTTHYNSKYKPFIIYNVLTKYDVGIIITHTLLLFLTYDLINLHSFN